jgi:RNA polymerase sigma factor (sigma-70 family)
MAPAIATADQMSTDLRVVRKHSTRETAERPGCSAETEALLQDDQRALVAALKELPTRQREALVLRHWLGLREAEIAAAMGISCGAVKSHTSRGMAALTRVLEERR